MRPSFPLALAWIPFALVALALPAACGSSGEGAVAPADATVSADGSGDGGVVLHDASPPADAGEPAVPTLSSRIVDPAGDSTLTARGPGLTAATAVTFDGAPVPFRVEGTALRWKAPPSAAGSHTVAVTTPSGSIPLGTVEAWSPTALAAAHVFDARDGVTTGSEREYHLWTRTAPAIAPYRAPDGKVTTWTHRDGACVTYLPATKRYWMVGGWNGNEADTPAPGWASVSTNEVWSSADGASWKLELPHTGVPAPAGRFSPRHYFGCVTFQNRLWIVGGDYTDGQYFPSDTPGEPDVWGAGTRYHDDVWSTADGVNWTKSPAPLPWAVAPINQPRMLHVTGVYKNKIWVFGGQNGFIGEDPSQVVFHNDLWSTSDGATWTRVQADDRDENQTTRPTPRGIMSDLVEFNGRLFLVGGARYTPDDYEKYYAEVWSTDAVDSGSGITWKKHKAPPWIGRRYGAVKVFDGKIWLINGYTNDLSFNLREVWWSTNGDDWVQDDPWSLPWHDSHADGIAVAPKGFVYASGNFGLGNFWDSQTFRMDLVRGPEVMSWAERAGSLRLLGSAGGRPLRRAGLGATEAASGTMDLDFDTLGGGASLVFDRISAQLDLGARALQPAGRTVLWVGRAPHVPDDGDNSIPHSVKNPQITVVADSEDGTQDVAFGLDRGAAALTTNRANGWGLSTFGGGFSENPGKIAMVGFTQTPAGATVAYTGGRSLGAATLPYGTGWRTVGAGAGGYDRFFGQLGAVVIVDRVASAEEIEKVHQWAQGRWSAE